MSKEIAGKAARISSGFRRVVDAFLAGEGSPSARFSPPNGSSGSAARMAACSDGTGSIHFVSCSGRSCRRSSATGRRPPARRPLPASLLRDYPTRAFAYRGSVSPTPTLRAVLCRHVCERAPQPSVTPEIASRVERVHPVSEESGPPAQRIRGSHQASQWRLGDPPGPRVPQKATSMPRLRASAAFMSAQRSAAAASRA